MSRQALEMALETLERSVATCFDQRSHDAVMGRPEHFVNQAITAIKEALAQPEQEPVAFYVYKPTLPRGHLGNVSDGDLPWVYDQDPSSGYSARMLVYTTPPQRTWVGLTNEDKQTAFDATQEGGGFWEFADAIEAKLKDKNEN